MYCARLLRTRSTSAGSSSPLIPRPRWMSTPTQNGRYQGLTCSVAFEMLSDVSRSKLTDITAIWIQTAMLERKDMSLHALTRVAYEVRREGAAQPRRYRETRHQLRAPESGAMGGYLHGDRRSTNTRSGTGGDTSLMLDFGLEASPETTFRGKVMFLETRLGMGKPTRSRFPSRKDEHSSSPTPIMPTMAQRISATKSTPLPRPSFRQQQHQASGKGHQSPPNFPPTSVGSQSNGLTPSTGCDALPSSIVRLPSPVSPLKPCTSSVLIARKHDCLELLVSPASEW